MRHPTILLFGPPGAGKGTAAKTVMEYFTTWLRYRASGDVVREILQNEGPLQQQVKSYTDQGMLIPDELMVDVFRASLASDVAEFNPLYHKFLIDGIPRTYAQAQALDDLFEVQAIMHFDRVTPQTLEQRMLRRAHQATLAGKKSRNDDNPGAIKRRIEEYETLTLPTLEFYKKVPIYTINAHPCEDEERSKEMVSDQLTTCLLEAKEFYDLTSSQSRYVI